MEQKKQITKIACVFIINIARLLAKQETVRGKDIRKQILIQTETLKLNLFICISLRNARTLKKFVVAI